MAIHSPADYTVACICPMGLELAAVEGMLDNTHTPFGVNHVQDSSNAYVLGEIGGHFIVIAVLPEVGNNSAARVATRLLIDFPAIRFCFLVGIGGAVPSDDADIRLGDVVVSRGSGTSGGVVQYDLGKRLTGGEFQRTGQLNKPPDFLSAHVRKLEAQHHRKGNELDSQILQMIERHPSMSTRYSRPKHDVDRLFLPMYLHEGESSSCERCDSQHLVHRPERLETCPVIHYGVVGSANVVLRDAKMREELRKQTGILCVEMEAAGLMDTFPCIVVRGISDYADSHKNNQWQHYAAATAAAYMKELLQAIPARKVTETGLPRDMVDTQIMANVVQQDFAIATKQTSEVLEALFVSDPEEDLQELKRKRGTRVDSTCAWLLETPEFTTWLQDVSSTESPSEFRSGILWLHGLPGSGKSTMSIFISEHLSKTRARNSAQTVAYYFCDASIAKRSTATSILRGFIYQVLQQNQYLLPTLYLRYRERGKSIFTAFDALWSIITIITGALSPNMIYWVIDALDECEAESRVDLLKQISESVPDEGPKAISNLRVLITSRPYPELEEYLGLCPNLNPASWPQYKRDIDIVIDHRVRQLQKTKRYTAKITQEIERLLHEHAGGTFLWIGLACDEMSRVSAKDALKCLLTFPKRITEVYNKLLDDALSQKDEEARATIVRILGFVSVAEEPMTISELGRLCLLHQDQDEQDQMVFIKNWIDECRSLITVQDYKIFVLHKSVLDFLKVQSFFKYDPPALHTLLAQRCIDSLCESPGEVDHFHPSRIRRRPPLLRSAYTFVNYCARVLPWHIQQAGTFFKVEESQESFFLSRTGRLDFWRGLLKYLDGRRPEILFDEGSSVYHIAAAYRSIPLFEHFLPIETAACEQAATNLEFHDENFRDSSGRTPIMLAALCQNLDILSCMLQHVSDKSAAVTRTIEYMHRHGGLSVDTVKLLEEVTKADFPLELAVQAAVHRNARKLDVLEHLVASHGEKLSLSSDLMDNVAGNPYQGAEMLKILVSNFPDLQPLSGRTVAQVARCCMSPESLLVLLPYSSLQDLICELTMVAACSNPYAGPQLIRMLLKKYKVMITVNENVVLAALRNVSKCHLILQEVADAIPADFIVTEDILSAVVRSPYRACELLEIFIRRFGMSMTVTEYVMILALRHQTQCSELVNMLLTTFGDRISVTDSLLHTGAMVANHTAMGLLIDRYHGSITSISGELLSSTNDNSDAAARHQIRELLSKYHHGNPKFSRRRAIESGRDALT